MRTVLIMLLVACFTVAGAAWGQVPKLVSYQGVLTDGGGGAVPNGTYDITFSMYDVETGGSALWTETQSLSVVGGIFNANLGSQTSLNPLPFDVVYWLGVSVDGGSELVPRRILTATPYALNADAVNGQSNVFPSAGNVGVGTTTPSAPLEVHFDNLSSNNAAISIDNDTPGGSDVIDFKYQGNTKARIRYSSGGAFYVGQLGNNHVHLQTNDANRLTVHANGNVMIGATGNPVEKLDVEGALRLGTTVSNNAGTLRWTGADFEGYDGGTWQSLTAGGAGSLPPGTEGQTLRHDGANWMATSFLDLGSSTETAELNIYRSGVTVPTATIYSDTYGGHLETYDELGNYTARIGTDVTGGTGGRVYIQRNETSYGFYVEGNWSSTEEPGVGIVGSTRMASFRMDQSGDAAVEFPSDAISSPELWNEPGVASYTSNTAIDLTGGYDVLGSRTITAPTGGWVLVIGTCQAQATHSTGTTSNANFGVSDVSTSFPANQELAFYTDGAAPSGIYMTPVTAHGLFAVTAGDHTFYLLGQETGGTFFAHDLQLTVLFIGSQYGTIQPTLASANSVPDDQLPTRSGLSQAEIDAERAQSIAANQARIERELAEMRARLEQLEVELAREQESR